MLLSIITINRNNSKGLERTMLSVCAQTYKDFEYIVIDGASTDGSVEVVKEHEASFCDRLRWISEPDGGIYNAMNKGISMATGEYVEFLNSGDCLASKDVVHSMFGALAVHKYPDIIYGNMIKTFPDGRLLLDRCGEGKDISLLFFYKGCLNHSPAFIKRSLFSKYGLYDESLKICSDWKWYFQSIVLGDVNPVYVDINVSVFDMTGISETNKTLLNDERSRLLKELVPPRILSDYDKWYSSICQIRRINKYPIAKRLVWFMERVLFKYEKLIRKINEKKVISSISMDY